jgi:hypothetical protein
MALTIKCFTCEQDRALESMETPWPFCGPECEDAFCEVVYSLMAGQTLTDLDPASLLGRQAIEEVRRLRRAEMIERREWKEWEYERSRPRNLRPLYPC